MQMEWNIKINLKETEYEDLHRIQLTQVRFSGPHGAEYEDGGCAG